MVLPVEILTADEDMICTDSHRNVSLKRGDRGRCADRVTLGRYRIHQQVGSGKQGQVFLASCRQMNGHRKRVALKVAHADVAVRRGGLCREASVLQRLSHRNIVKWEGQGSEGGLDYFAMEWVEGWSVREIHRRVRSIPVPIVLHWAIQLCDALEVCHNRKIRGVSQPIVHCDLKTNNLLIDKSGQLKLLDFGIAWDAAHDLERRDNIVGTAAYMAPEQVSRGPLGPRTDLFAVGALLYEFATGRRLFKSQNLKKMLQERLRVDESLATANEWMLLRKSCPPLVPVVKRCVRQQPGERFPSARALSLRLRLLSDRLGGTVDWFGIRELMFAEAA